MAQDRERWSLLPVNDQLRVKLAGRLAAPMFVASFLFLTIIAASINRIAGAAYRNEPSLVDFHDLRLYSWGILLLWPGFVAESIAQIALWDRNSADQRVLWRAVLNALCPPLRMGARSPAMNGRVWLPKLGWQDVDRELVRRLERFFSVPMIVVALMILPVLAVEHFWKAALAQDGYAWLLILLDASTSVIWLAFATEFVIMVSVAESSWKYCRTHWVDLVIILLPLVSFLRCLRAMRLARLMRAGRLAKLTQSLSSMSRLYRLRGLAFRAYRALLVLQLLEKIRPVPPERRLQQLREELAVKEEEMGELRREIEQIETKLNSDEATQSSTPPHRVDPMAEQRAPSVD